MPGIDSAVRTITHSAQHTTNLAASATLTGPTIDGGADPETWPTRTRPTIRHATSAKTAHAQLVLQESSDGSTWVDIKSSPIPADGETRSFDWPLHWRYHRLLVRNGAQAQTGMRLSYTDSRGDGGSVDEQQIANFVVSQTALGASATLTSNVIDLGPNNTWSLVRLMSRQDQPGAAGGMQIQFSEDGVTNWFAAPDGLGNPTNVGSAAVESKVYQRFVRFLFVNGTTAQGFFRLWATLVSL